MIGTYLKKHSDFRIIVINALKFDQLTNPKLTQYSGEPLFFGVVISRT